MINLAENSGEDEEDSEPTILDPEKIRKIVELRKKAIELMDQLKSLGLPCVFASYDEEADAEFVLYRNLTFKTKRSYDWLARIVRFDIMDKKKTDHS